MAFAAALLLRGIPLLRARVGHVRAPSWRHFSGLSASDELPSPQSPAPPATGSAPAGAKGPDPPPLSKVWGGDEPEYRRWKDKEKEILNDIEQITTLTKDILHSDRYMDGECLSAEDEKAVVEKLLAYHPHSEDKIGCGLDSVMVDRHPQFRKSRCLFVVRTDGGWIDFSYQKCLRAYIRDKYPSHAERFLREHFKRS